MKTLVVLLPLLLFASPSFAAIVQNTPIIENDGDSIASKIIPYTVPSGAAMVLLAVAALYDDNATDHLTGGVTYNSVPMNRIAVASRDNVFGGRETVYVYGLLLTGDGISHNVSFTFSPNMIDGFFGIVSYSGVAAIGASPVARFSLAATSPFTDNISVGAGNLAVDAIMTATTGIAKDASQTAVGEVVGNGGFDEFGMSQKLSAAAMAWTFSGTKDGAHVIVELVAAGSGAIVRHSIRE